MGTLDSVIACYQAHAHRKPIGPLYVAGSRVSAEETAETDIGRMKRAELGARHHFKYKGPYSVMRWGLA